ncbi:phosphotransferase [Hamadaea tsunoensis]|uniref:phosphotransferase n=1 Tax=Hamadaea tsunoensis TaxID=53368 RepID=UPI0003F8D758|nr:phosphotransferase [Hamadaea tsunoensis]
MDTAYLRAMFGWSGEVAATPGARGATARIWRLDVAGERFALKEILGEPPTDAAVLSEVEYVGRAAALGVRVALPLPDRTGRYLVTDPDGRVLRLYTWIDLRPVVPSQCAAALGALLARLHRAAPATPDRPSSWYETAPEVSALMAAAPAARPEFAPDPGEVAELLAIVAPSAPDRLRVCHRDLHPENVQADPAGDLVVLDWDDLGPADPARELARVLFDWFCDGPSVDAAAIRALLRAYAAAGGPARITGRADFSLLIATRLNFLRSQYALLGEPDRRDWAYREIEEGVRLLPTRRLIDEVLATALNS